MKEDQPLQKLTPGIPAKDILKLKDFQFPYETILSLTALIKYWEEKEQSGDKFVQSQAKYILNEVNKYPELRKASLNSEDLAGKEKIVKLLLSNFFSDDLSADQAFAASAPFGSKFVYISDRFNEIYENAIFCPIALKQYEENNPKVMNAIGMILKEIYGIKTGVMDIPIVIPTQDKMTGLGKFYKINLENTDFISVEKKHKLDNQEVSVCKTLAHKQGSLEEWLQYFPVDEYLFRGVVLVKLVDITEQETLNRIQSVLLENSTISSTALQRIGKLTSNYLESPKLKVGLIGLDKNNNILQAEKEFGLSIMLDNHVKLNHEKVEYMISEFEKGKKLIFINEATEEPLYKKIYKKLNTKGLSDLVVAPLYKENRMIGLFEITMNSADHFSAYYVNRLYRLLPLFEMALDRSVENVNNKIQHIIKDHATAIHPSVEWMFFSEAIKLYKNKLSGEASDQMADIVFEDVIPVYGLSDIRSSSLYRSDSIRQDLLHQLQLAKTAIEELNKSVDILMLENTAFRIGKKIGQLEHSSGSSEDEDFYDFLEKDVNQLLKRLKKDARYDKKIINRYLDSLDTKVGILYSKRKDFDYSLSRINTEISRFLENEQSHLQKIYPHYFDKYMTDGIDYNIYIGQSICPNLPYHSFYLKNLRLWQLSSMCKIALLNHNLKKELPIPLDTVQLILVQNLPINIKFRYEEKRFDIDSAYNARYEIVKKRIDKATIANTGERLTKPGTIAIVYSNNIVLKEYEGYFDYLRAQEVIVGETEYLELEKLKGTDELKALRITVNLESKVLNDDLFTEKVLESLES